MADPETGNAADDLLDEMRSAGEFFRGLLDAAPDAIVIVDDTGHITLINRQAEASFGYPREELFGQSVDVLVPERYRTGHAGERAGYTADPHLRPMGIGLELFARRKDGSEFPVEISLSPVQAEDETLIISIIRDISTRRRIEHDLRRAMAAAESARAEAERASQAKSEFLSRMSHELRTPLNAVLGFAQLLEMDPLTPTQHANVRRIIRGGRHLLDLINEVLDIARIESGRLQLSPEPVRMTDALREAVDLVRPIADEHNVRLHVDPALTCDHFVTADRQRLKQVLLNVLANGAKYNRPGGSVSASCRVVGGTRLRLDFRDTGPGIPPDKLDRLFSPFERLGAEMTEVEGTGLGLALSKGLIEAMGGTITGASVPGEGSTFSVELALDESPIERHERAEAGAEVPVGGADGAVRTVLYVEDNLPNLELIEQIFARFENVNLVPAMQGRLGLDLAAQHQPDLILLDLHLPDMNGLDVLRHLQADIRTRDIPVVMISADATPGQIDRLLRVGARTYLTKPLDVQRFLAVVTELLEQPGP